MARKSLLVSMEVTIAGRAHNCRYNNKHRIEKGDPRLTVKADRDNHNYCIACAKVFLADSASRLEALRLEVEQLAARKGSS